MTHLVAGDNITLHCNGYGQPAPELHWLTDDIKSEYTTTELDNNLHDTSSLDFPIAQNSHFKSTTLDLYNARPEDTGQIICEASNVVGFVQTAIHIFVHCK